MIKEFKSLSAYLVELGADTGLAVIGITDVGLALGLTRSTIEKKLANGQLDGVRIGKSLYVTTSSIHAEMEIRQNRYEMVEANVIDAATKRDTIIYSDLMSSVGMNYRMSRDRLEIGKILAVLSTKYFKKHEIILSSIVVAKGTDIPSEQFFNFIEDLEFDVKPNKREKWCRKEQNKVWNHFTR